jgi:hypothetical protein
MGLFQLGNWTGRFLLIKNRISTLITNKWNIPHKANEIVVPVIGQTHDPYCYPILFILNQLNPYIL